MQMTDLVVVMCPPYHEYKEAPEDQSYSELQDCPKCKRQMWLSEKKKKLLMFAACLEKDILLACYDCITQMAKDDPSLFTESEQVNL
jgi:hypothetical protein